MGKIQLIYGPKGCGKTKKLVQIANDSVADAKGSLVYIDKDMSRIHDLAHAIKLVDTSEYDVRGEDTFLAFVKGMLAGNYDIQTIFFDGIVKIVKKDIVDLQGLFSRLEKVAETSGVDFIFTFSTQGKLPEYLTKYQVLYEF